MSDRAMRFDNLQDWLNWQETLHPATIDLGLERVSAVWNRLCHDGLRSTVISVAGTNGKGSSCAMLESIYRHAGYRVGCYTSPHLLHYNERIRLCGELVDDEVLCEAFAAVDEARDGISLTYFEFGTLAALQLFADAGLDVVILEVGLGGRLDAVNIIDADVALLTSVGLDHQQWLGDDRETIGLEKAGIFRPGRPAVCAETEPPRSVIDYAREHAVPLRVNGQSFRYTEDQSGWVWYGPQQRIRQGLPKPALRGPAQLQNASAVLMVVALLEASLPVTQDQLRQGLLDIRLPGRFQVLAGDVPVILDVAHNEHATRVLRQNLHSYACSGRIHAVCGMLQDKDAAAVAGLLKQDIDHWYLGTIHQPRGMTADALGSRLTLAGISTYAVADDVWQAYLLASNAATAGDCILVFGSFYTVADILRRLSQSTQ